MLLFTMFLTFFLVKLGGLEGHTIYTILCTKFGSGQSSDCPAQSSDLTFVQQSSDCPHNPQIAPNEVHKYG